MVAQQLRFPPFRLDVVNNLLWREEHQIPLRPKTLAVLRVLVEKSGQIVSREELFQTVWGGTVVSDNVLKVCVSEIREALGDDRTRPRFVETLPKQGYRFIASLSPTPSVVSRQFSAVGPQLPDPNPQAPTPSLVGRDTELAQLTTCWQRALNGERQIVFITGEPGIGKTALIDAFRQRLETGDLRLAPSPQTSSLQSLASPVWFGRGQCIEHYGAGEAYLPVLEALEQSAHTPAREQITTLLNQYAPLWLAQMPALLSASDRERLQRELQGVTADRMLREIAAFLEALTAVTPLVVMLEDLHWSDTATLTLLSAIARRRQTARLLVVGTYRSTDIPAAHHPLTAVTQELRLHRQCQEIPLQLLSEDAVAEYLAGRFAGQSVPRGLAGVVHQRTEGNPLFMVNLIEHVLAQNGGFTNLTTQSAVNEALRSFPDSLRQMLVYQIERLPHNAQQLLAVASVAGMEFTAATIAPVLDMDEPTVERECDGLAQRQMLSRALPSTNAFADKEETNRYIFRHALFHQTFYDRLGLARRRQLHQQIGEQKEREYRSRAGEIAAELAVHFSESRDATRALQYLEQAARTALRRSAHHEAKDHLSHALEWLARLPESEDRTKRELDLQLMLGVTLMSTQGFSSPQVQQTYAHARQLCQHLGSTPQLFPALWGLRFFYHVRAEYGTACEVEEQLLQLAEATKNVDLLVEAHLALGTTLMFQGDIFGARTHLEESLREYNPQQHRSHAYAYGQDPAVLALCHLASLLAGMGYFDQAAMRINQAISIAEEIAHPFSQGYARAFAGAIYSARSEPQMILQHAEQTIVLAQAQGFPHFQVMGTLLYGWALAGLDKAAEGAQHLQHALDAQKQIGFEVGRSFYLALFAEVLCSLGQWERGLAAVTEGFERVEQKGEWFYAAELYRIKGELTLAQSKTSLGQVKTRQDKSEDLDPRPLTPDPQGDAEVYFLKAIDIARQQTTKLFELRATMALCRLWQTQGNKDEARKRLAELCGWFTEGVLLPDLQRAKELLEELSNEDEEANVKRKT